MALGRRDEASTSAVGLAVAAATIAASFVVAEIMVTPPSGVDSRTASLTEQSATALGIIVTDPGVAEDGLPWALSPDKLVRFGLAADGNPNFIDYAKVRALRNGTMKADPANNAPDYPEVRAALGIEEADLHIRSYPVMPGVDDPRWTKDRYGRIGYFAHVSGATSPVEIEQAYTLTSTKLNVSIELKNAGMESAIYTTMLSLGDKDSGATYVTAERHTRLLAPGESQTVWVEFHGLKEWESSIDAVKAEVWDGYGKSAVGPTGVTIGTFWFATRPPTVASRTVNLDVSADAPYFVSGDSPTFTVRSYDGKGEKIGGASGRFVLISPSGAEIYNNTLTTPTKKNEVWTYTCTSCTTPGTYTAFVYYDSLARRQMDQIHVSAARLFAGRQSLDPIAAKEATIVGSLVTNFNPTMYDAATNPEGDIFGDDVNGPDGLKDVIGRYTTFIVGSEVSQTALTPSQTKRAIRDWVLAGGNLIVLGTNQQQSQWLEPIWDVAQETANGGISAPDPTHPVLSAPNRLQYDSYLDRARAWKVKEASDFTHVLTRGEAADESMQDTLAVSEPGTFGNGTVVLTTYMPGYLTEPQDDQEARRFLHNLMSQGYTMLFLDFGPPIPEDTPVGSSARLVAVPHPNVPGAVVEVRLVLYLFG